MTWNESTTPIPNPAGYGTTDDEKIAYREGSNGSPELIAIFRGFSTTEGTFLNYSSDNGITWEYLTPYYTGQQKVELNDGVNKFTQRPLITTDPTSNNAYIAWSTEGNESYVNVATIASGGQTLSNKYYDATALETGGIEGSGADTASYVVEACNISVDANGYIYLLWRKRYLRTSTFVLYIDESKNGGVTWTKEAATITKDAAKPEDDERIPQQEVTKYVDYATMTISSSPSTCAAGDSIFVAYPQLPQNIADNGISDLYLASAALSAGSIGAWGTYNINGDNVDWGSGYTNTLLRQFEPSLAPDGLGGVFLLYYSGAVQPSYMRTEEEGISAVLFETGNRPQVVLSYSQSEYLMNQLSDYIGIVWDPDQSEAFPVWTDIAYSPITHIWSIGIPDLDIAGTVSNPALGDLGFSNQRRIVMTDNMAHLIGFGGKGSGLSDNPEAIWYSEQTSNSAGTALDWTPPYHLGESSSLNQTPAEGVYQMGGSSGQKAIAVVWPAGSNPELGYRIEYRIKEWCICDGGEGSNWSPLQWFGIGSAPVNVAIAPLTVPVTGSGLTASAERYLLGWVITWETDGLLMSKTVLRGGQLTTGTNPAAMQNEDWGARYDNFTLAPAQQGQLFPYTNNVLVNDGAIIPSPERLVIDGFVTATSNESKGTGTLNPGDLTQEVIFTGDGTKANTDVWDVNPTYVTTPTPSLGAQGTNLGELNIAPPGQCATTPLDAPKAEIIHEPSGISIISPPRLYFDRNPSVTITSTGQKIVAWEHEDCSSIASSSTYSCADCISQPTPCPAGALDYASIRTRKTLANGWTDPTYDEIVGSANDLKFDWLRNPSVTAFPKTPLPDNSSLTTDQDPGAAELLFWQQNAITPSRLYCNYTESSSYTIHERQFDEAKGPNHWLGGWSSRDPQGGIPEWPTSNDNGFPGANSQ
ncbi:MAG TPA: hypothetical protein VFH95_03375, partial [Candidatus Kapabacteria bacterium]|nr:hypothetical protein [Candidatus Kapabacteria bacterium]